MDRCPLLHVFAKTRMQRIAHKLLIVCCGVMTAGLSATAAVRTTATPVVQAVSQPASNELLKPVTHTFASPVLPVHRTALSTDKLRTIRMMVTAYCPCKICCGAKARGITASGKRVTHDNGRFVAADTSLLPFGTKLSIPGYHDGAPVEVIDRGGAIKGKHIDVFFPTHQQAKEWGVRYVNVTIGD
jgi:3D (Asp-Asp-Asp) domain-containing protein